MERVGRAIRYPFVAVVGQSRLKLALLLLAIDPRIGGLLIIGEKGSAKSTLARGVADLLEDGAPFVELPVGATEDRVIGTLDLSGVINNRSEVFKPGLLVQANSGVLYVDEVNLLQDHIVDVMLDAAASGTVRIEREGFSIVRDARFVLCGSMNPEEGELRPQLLDRFGFAVNVDALSSVEERAEAVTRRVEYEADPELFIVNFKDETDTLREKVVTARRLLNGEGRSRKDLLELAKFAAQVSIAHGAEGLRSDLALVRGAVAYAALCGRSEATEEDLIEISSLALLHRSRRSSEDHSQNHARSYQFEGQKSDQQLTGGGSSEERGTSLNSPEVLDGPGRVPSEEGGGISANNPHGVEDANAMDDSLSSDSSGQRGRSGSEADRQEIGNTSDMSNPSKGEPGLANGDSQSTLPETFPPPGRVMVAGSRNRPTQFAPRVDAERKGGSPLAVRETVANSLRRLADDGQLVAGTDINFASSDLVFKRLLLLEERCVVFLVDTSGSMGSIKRVEAAKLTIEKLLGDAYLKRHSVAMITFQGAIAETILMPTRSIEVANSRLGQIKRGGKTPLHLGLRKVAELSKRLRAKGTEPFVVVMTDGMVSTSQAGIDPVGATLEASREIAEARIEGIIVDFDLSDPKVGIATEVAKTAKLSYVAA